MSDKESKTEEKKPIVIKNTTDLQRLKLEKLMKNPNKPVVIPDPPKSKSLQAPPDFVRNVMGSSAGAGSGEFHVYRHLRRKEYARQKFIQEKSEKEKLDEEYHKKIELNRREAQEKTAKKRAKRLKKKKLAKLKGKKPKTDKQTVSSQSDSSSEGDSDGGVSNGNSRSQDSSENESKQNTDKCDGILEKVVTDNELNKMKTEEVQVDEGKSAEDVVLT